MDAHSVIETLRAHQAELTVLGVEHAGVFGSVARGQAGPDSDIDILVDFAAGRVPDLFTYVGIKDRIAALFPGKVDVVDKGGLRPRMRQRVMADILDAF